MCGVQAIEAIYAAGIVPPMRHGEGEVALPRPIEQRANSLPLATGDQGFRALDHDQREISVLPLDTPNPKQR